MNPYSEHSRILTEKEYRQRKQAFREKQRQEYIRRLKRKRQRRKIIVVSVLFIITMILFIWTLSLSRQNNKTYISWEEAVGLLPYEEEKPEWFVDYLTQNAYSRPGEALDTVNNIFVHYTANPGTSAAQNRSYFEQLKDTHERSASAHFIIGYEGEILQCIPLNEIAYAVQTRNYDSVSIECCYLNADGSFTNETEESLVELLVYLLKTYNLKSEDILRHYDCGGKKCPLYYVEHEDAWKKLKAEVAERLGEFVNDGKV